MQHFGKACGNGLFLCGNVVQPGQRCAAKHGQRPNVQGVGSKNKDEKSRFFQKNPEKQS